LSWEPVRRKLIVLRKHKNKHNQVTRWEEESSNIVLLLARKRNPGMGTLS